MDWAFCTEGISPYRFLGNSPGLAFRKQFGFKDRAVTTKKSHTGHVQNGDESCNSRAGEHNNVAISYNVRRALFMGVWPVSLPANQSTSDTGQLCCYQHAGCYSSVSLPPGVSSKCKHFAKTSPHRGCNTLSVALVARNGDSELYLQHSGKKRPVQDYILVYYSPTRRHSQYIPIALLPSVSSRPDCPEFSGHIHSHDNIIWLGHVQDAPR